MNKWFHLMLVLENNTLNIFVNGQDKTSLATVTGTISTMPSLLSGAYKNYMLGYFNNVAYSWQGSLVHVAQWDSDKSSDISTIYNNGKPGDLTSLSPKNWWKLTDGSLVDSGSEADNATAVGTLPTIVATNVNSNSNPGTSSGMTTANLVTSDLTRSIPYSSYSMEFDGAADYISCGSVDETEGITTMSISGWINPQSSGVGGAAGIIAKETRDWYVGWYSSPANSIRFLISDDNGSTKDALNSLTLGTNADVLNKWHHFVCTWDASDKLKIYINGVLSSETNSVNANSALPTSTNNVEIGRRVATYFDGNLSNIAIWTSVLTEDQILTIYNGGVPNNLSSLSPVSWWSLAGDSYYNGSDWICPDLGSSSNNGASSGMGGTELVGNGPGSTANGTATSMNIPENLKGNAPNSSKNAFSVNMNSADRVSDVAPTPPLLLDAYGTNIGGAYSFRKLSSTYSGNCIRVRRSSDDAEADIGFDGNYLDESALLAHTGTGGSDDGFITKWYDQSGAFVGTPSAINDGDLAQPTTTNQPRIVNSGAIVKGSGLVKAGDIARPYLSNPAAAGSGNGWMTGWGNTQDLAIFCVAYPTDTNAYDAWLGCATAGSTERGCIGINNSGTAPRYLTLRTQDGASYTQLTGTTPIAYDTFAVGTAVLKASPATTSLSLNGVSQGTLTNWTNLYFNKLAWPGQASGFGPDAAEFIIYQTPPNSSDIAGIEANIMNYYGIS